MHFMTDLAIESLPEALTSVMHDNRRSGTVTLSFLILWEAGEMCAELVVDVASYLSSRLSDLSVSCAVVALSFL